MSNNSRELERQRVALDRLNRGGAWKSYQARVYATGDAGADGWRHLLLGGVRESLSSRWETRKLAVRYGETAVKINIDAGRPAAFEVIKSDLPPEIMAAEVAP